MFARSSCSYVCQVSEEFGLSIRVRIRVEKTTKSRAPGTLQLQKARAVENCHNIVPSTPFTLAPPMCWVPHTYIKTMLLVLCLCLGLCLGLGFKKPQSPERQGHFSCKRHAKGSMALPHHYSLHTFLLGTFHVPGTVTSAKDCFCCSS